MRVVAEGTRDEVAAAERALALELEETWICPQCYQGRPKSHFIGKRKPFVNWCKSCRARVGPKGAYTRAAPRGNLPVGGPLRVLLVPRSGNPKLGGLPTSLTSAQTCSPRCGLYKNGCHAEFVPMAAHWARVGKDGMTWRDFTRAIAALPEGQLWRHNEAGDLPGVGSRIAVGPLGALVQANLGKRGFTFTHKPMTSASNRRAVKLANAAGFTINLSADGLEQADELAALGIAPVVAVVPRDAPERTTTPSGRAVIVCLADTKGLTCASCRLCAVPTRKSIVAFRAHGQMWRTVEQLVRGKR